MSTHSQFMDQFVALSKCLAGLNSVLPQSASEEEYQNIEDLRRRVAASMNYTLDMLDMPKPKDTAASANNDVNICVAVCVAGLRKLRDELLVRFPTVEHGQIIRAAVDAAVNRIGSELHSKLVDKTVEIK